MRGGRSVPEPYYRWRTSEVAARRLAGEIGHITPHMPRDELLMSIESVFGDFNRELCVPGGLTMAVLFEKCGQLPFVEDDTVFREHLESLSQEGVYEALLRSVDEFKMPPS